MTRHINPYLRIKILRNENIRLKFAMQTERKENAYHSYLLQSVHDLEEQIMTLQENFLELFQLNQKGLKETQYDYTQNKHFSDEIEDLVMHTPSQTECESIV